MRLCEFSCYAGECEMDACVVRQQKGRMRHASSQVPEGVFGKINNASRGGAHSLNLTFVMCRAQAGDACVPNNLVNNEHQPKRCMISGPELVLVFVRKTEAEKEQKLAFRGKRIQLCSASQQHGGFSGWPCHTTRLLAFFFLV